jgi:hypothetical protein
VADTRASATLARLHRDDLLVIHGANLAHFCADAAAFCDAHTCQGALIRVVSEDRSNAGFPLSLNGIGEGYDKLP